MSLEGLWFHSTLAAWVPRLPAIKQPRRPNQRRLQRCGGADQDRDRVAAGVVDKRAGFQLLASHTLPDGSMAIPVFRIQSVARIASAIRRDGLAHPALGRWTLGRVDAAEVADPVRRFPHRSVFGMRQVERKAEIGNPDRIVTVDRDSPWNRKTAASERRADMRLATGMAEE